jgi:predicted signal transduction protein with EAL and GGDEF domain
MMQSLAPLRWLSGWFWQQSRLTRDLIVLGAVGLAIYCLAVWYDAFDRFLALTNEPESDTIDWLIILFVFLGVAAKIYSVRRTIDLHHEVRQRRKAEADAYQLARQDVLTGLPNRRWFTEEFDKWSTEHNGAEVSALFVVDLDNFKPIIYGTAPSRHGHVLGEG